MLCAPHLARLYRVLMAIVLVALASPAVLSAATAPTAPSNLVATPSELSPAWPTVTLTWVDNSIDEVGFYVERVAADPAAPAPLPSAWVRVASVPAEAGSGNTVTWVDGSVQRRTYYEYRVQSFNDAGLSEYCWSFHVLTPGVVPEAPTKLHVGDATTDSLTLTWSQTITSFENQPEGFYVERSLDGVTWTRLPATIYYRSYIDTSLAPRTFYCYRVQAYNQDGLSGYSDEGKAKTR